MEISQRGLLRHLGGVCSTSQNYIRSSKTLCTLVNIHDYLSDTTFAMTLTSSDLYAVKWMPDQAATAFVAKVIYPAKYLPLRPSQQNSFELSD